MKAHLVTNQQEFIQAYFYGEQYAKNNLPSSYPIVLVVKTIDGGLSGDRVEHEVITPPNETTNITDYFNGIVTGLALLEE